MKIKWKIVVGVFTLGTMLLSPVGANAEPSDYIRFSSNDLMDEFQSNYRKFYAENQQREEIDLLDEKYDTGELTDEEYDEAVAAVEQKWEEKIAFTDEYGIFPKEYIASVEGISPDWVDDYTNFNGLENATNLKSLTGEEGTTKDLRPLRKLEQLEEVMLEVTNQVNLYDLKDAENLKYLRLSTSGVGNHDDEDDRGKYTQAVLTDISDISDLTGLNRINIDTEGIMPTITLKQGTTSYQLYDPVVPSSQFTGATISYRSDISSNEWVEWNNLTGEEEYLTFNWGISKGNHSYSGEAQIPIRWK